MAPGAHHCEPTLLQDSQNASNTRPGFANSPSGDWAAAAARKVQALLCYLDRRFPGKIFGLQLNGMETGEWFGAGMGGHGDAGFFGDYSNATRREWGAAPPTAGLRDAPTIGNTLVSGAGPAGVPAFNHWFAKRTVRAFATLARAAKQVSGGNVFTAFYYGYLYELSGSRLAGSGHLAVSELMQEPAIDGVLSPYSYGPESRNFTMPLVPHGVVDSAWLHGKVHVIEDDSRSARTRAHAHTPERGWVGRGWARCLHCTPAHGFSREMWKAKT